MANLYSDVAGVLRTDQVRLDSSSINAANATTPGYRRSLPAIGAFDRVFKAAGEKAAGAIGPTPRAAMVNGVDLTPAGLMATGRALDLAIDGPGFFAFSDGSSTWLARTVSLHVNEQGVLVGPSGKRIVGDVGLLKDSTSPSIDAAGQVFSGSQMLGRLTIFMPESVAKLQSIDGVFFETDQDNLNERRPDQYSVRAGFLESSNSDGLKEMTGVMATLRHYESVIRLLQGYDELLGRTISKLGEV